MANLGTSGPKSMPIVGKFGTGARPRQWLDFPATLPMNGIEPRMSQRFSFGRNWQKFLQHVDKERIEAAQSALVEMVGGESLEGLRFLDIGSGSGLSSLAARRLGARVVSFDYDPQSVACTTELRRQYFPDDSEWRVEQGSILDLEYVDALGQFDIVYSWGVLHHTGQMRQGLAAAARLVSPGGTLFIAFIMTKG